MASLRLLGLISFALVLSVSLANTGMNNPLHHARDHVDHILDDLAKVVTRKTPDEMTDQELQYHYFKLHDFDNNNRLDGLELGKALTHHEHEIVAEREGIPLPPDNGQPSLAMPENELTEVIDGILKQDDGNKDGYIDFYEFMHSTVAGGEEDTAAVSPDAGAPAGSPPQAGAPAGSPHVQTP